MLALTMENIKLVIQDGTQNDVLKGCISTNKFNTIMNYITKDMFIFIYRLHAIQFKMAVNIATVRANMDSQQYDGDDDDDDDDDKQSQLQLHR